MTDDIDKVIAGLTKAQRAGVLSAKPFAFGAWLIPLGYGRGLAPMGVATRTCDGMCLSPAGLAVRQRLIEQETTK